MTAAAQISTTEMELIQAKNHGKNGANFSTTTWKEMCGFRVQSGLKFSDQIPCVWKYP